MEEVIVFGQNMLKPYVAFYSGEIGHQFQMKSAIESGRNKAS